MPSSSKQAPSQVFGFGSNYYRNMGQATKQIFNHGSEEEIEVYTFDASEDSSPPPWTTEDDPIVDIACSSSASYFLTTSGKLYTCGTMHGRIRPKLTRKIIQLPLKCSQLATGRHFVLAKMEGGLAVCSWGAGHFGQLGLGNDSAPCIEHPTVIESLLPHVVGSPISSVAAGYWHSMAVTQAGQLYSWGCNRSAQCGMKPQRDPPTICYPNLVRFAPTDNSTASTGSPSSTSSSNNTRSQIIKIAGGRSHSVALDSNGQVYCFGATTYGQCGQVSRRRGVIAPPKHVEALAQVTIVDIAAGDSHTLALTGGGRLFGWGGGFEGQLGIGTIVQLNPKPKLIGDIDFVAIQAQQQVTQQQYPDVDTNASGITAADLSEIPRIYKIFATGNSSVAISTAGHAYSWGCNDVGNIGIPKPTDPDSIVFSEPGMPQPKNSTLRQLHTMSFDSTHNVALPVRIDSLGHVQITAVAGSPTFFWFLARQRTSEEEEAVIGRTLYEVQEGKRFQIIRGNTADATIARGGNKLGSKTANRGDTVNIPSAMKKSTTTTIAEGEIEEFTDKAPESQTSLTQTSKAPDSQSSIPMDPPEFIDGTELETDITRSPASNSMGGIPPKSPKTPSAMSPSSQTSKSKRRFNLKKLASKMAKRASFGGGAAGGKSSSTTNNNPNT